MYTLNRANRNSLISIFSLIAMIFVLGIFKTTSKYQPKPLVIKVVNERSIFDLENRIECVPGHTSEGSPYTMGLTPGGLCGAQELVSEQAGYEIEDGIGGSLI
jgi:hypothetical protein